MRRTAIITGLIGVLGLAAVPAAAQNEAPSPLPEARPITSESLEAVLNLITDPEATADEIGGQLTGCLPPLAPDAPDHAPIVFDVTFDADGRPGAPVLVAPTQELAEQAHLRQLVRAETALIACAPLTAGGDTVADVTLGFVAEDVRITLFDDGLMPRPGAEDPAADPQTAEEALSMSRADRREIQERLRLAGFDPGGADGIFGPRTRGAIREWQQSTGLPTTGYLGENALETLAAQTEEAYAALRSAQPRATPSAPPRTTYYRGRDGCLRTRDGRIVPGQSLSCDVRGMVQGIGN